MEAEARQIYMEKKARYEELLHAKNASDEILSMFGIPKYGQSPVSFPGLEEARVEMDVALSEWQKAARRERV
jgi:hypothetical protein